MKLFKKSIKVKKKPVEKEVKVSKTSLFFKKLYKYIKRFIKVLIVALILYLLMLYIGQKTVIYPGAYFENEKIPKNSVLQLETIELQNSVDSNPIRLYKLAMREDNQKALIIFHGNADTAPNIINRLYNPYILYYGYDIYAMEYRGFDGVLGSPSEMDILSDSKDVLNYIKGNREYKTIVYYGHSLGTGIAANLVKEKVPDALVLEAPFSSLKDMASSLYPFIPKMLIDLMVRENYDSKSILESTEIPNLLILNAKNDQVIPYQQGELLYKIANSPNKVFKNYDTGEHSNIYLRNDIGDLRDFLLNLN